VKFHIHEKCKNQAHLDEELKKVLAKQGEGLMIKDPNSMYEGTRSDKLLKVKVFVDSEAKVLKHETGTGRCWNMMGKILVFDPKLNV
jgi:DNA ligase-1